MEMKAPLNLIEGIVSYICVWWFTPYKMEHSVCGKVLEVGGVNGWIVVRS